MEAAQTLWLGHVPSVLQDASCGIENCLSPVVARTRGSLVGLGFLCGYLASRLKSPVRVRVNLDWNEEATSVRAVRRFTKLLGGGIEA